MRRGLGDEVGVTVDGAARAPGAVGLLVHQHRRVVLGCGLGACRQFDEIAPCLGTEERRVGCALPAQQHRGEVTLNALAALFGQGAGGTEAVRYAGETVARTLRKELEAGPVAGLRAFLDLWRKIVVDTDFRAGCPVLAVSIEEPPTDETPAALVAAADVFNEWESLLAASLREHGAEPERAVQLATLIVAAVEGTVAMCRAKRSTQPLDQTAEQLQALIRGTCR
ncbi:hypothetical protein AB0D04_04145 [Streptomyces sp. NPDC048483]|uniref:LmrA/YxaF family transcription factor n=1 Tax=Streptomyces sp. NPDC048483 TaxID=3154927 RepID=UPI00343424AD